MKKNKWYDKKVIASVERKAADKLELATEFVVGAAKLNCPVDTGLLRDSINGNVNRSELIGTIGTPVEYAPHLEFGTAKQSSQPYLRPALFENVSTIKRILGA